MRYWRRVAGSERVMVRRLLPRTSLPSWPSPPQRKGALPMCLAHKIRLIGSLWEALPGPGGSWYSESLGTGSDPFVFMMRRLGAASGSRNGEERKPRDGRDGVHGVPPP